MTRLEKNKFASKLGLIFQIFKKTSGYEEFEITFGNFIHNFMFHFDKRFNVLSFEHRCSHRKSKRKYAECCEVFIYDIRFKKICETHVHHYSISRMAQARRELFSDLCVVDIERLLRAMDVMMISEI